MSDIQEPEAPHVIEFEPLPEEAPAPVEAPAEPIPEPQPA